MAGQMVRAPLALLALSWSARPAVGWPALYSDCSVFPALGEPQKRPLQHPPMSLLCEPVPPATFDYCAASCSVQARGGRQNCSAALCKCTEHCMGAEDVCTTNIPHVDPTHHSLPDALAAKPGRTGLLLDGAPINASTTYAAGRRYSLTVVPGDESSLPSWFLLDTGVGTLSSPPTRPSRWSVACEGSRASFVSSANAAVEVVWTAPAAAEGSLAIRVAEATGMGNLTISAAILNASTTGLAPPTEMGYACAVTEGLRPGGGVPTRQCMSVPVGTVGALTKPACETECFAEEPGASYLCLRCAHVYDAKKDGGGLAFEDLPDTWVCPICGAPKSAYAKQTLRDGSVQWTHDDEDRPSS